MITELIHTLMTFMRLRQAPRTCTFQDAEHTVWLSQMIYSHINILLRPLHRPNWVLHTVWLSQMILSHINILLCPLHRPHWLSYGLCKKDAFQLHYLNLLFHSWIECHYNSIAKRAICSPKSGFTYRVWPRRVVFIFRNVKICSIP